MTLSGEKYIPRGFRKPQGFYIEANDQKYLFVDHFKIKEDMSDVESARFKEALDLYSQEKITLEQLHRVAFEPDKYNSRGFATEEVVSVDEGAIDITNNEWVAHIKDEKSDPFAFCGIKWRELPASAERQFFTVCQTCQEVGLGRDTRYLSSEVNESYEDGIQIEFGQKVVTITKGDDSFEFANPFAFKQYMTVDEEKTVVRALVNFQHGVIDEKTFRAITARPDMLTSLGQILEAVPAEPYDGKIVDKCSKMDQRHRHFGNSACLPVGPEISEAVHHPSHYNQYKDVEVIEITEELNFNRGNAVKYVARAGFKNEDTEVQDLEKALWYLERELGRDNAELSLGDTNRVERLVEQMNFHRGTAVWLIALAGRQGNSSPTTDMTEATHSIKAEIARLKREETDQN